MNKRVYIWASVSVIILYIVSRAQLPVALFTFLVLGMIPGTDIALPSWVILVTYPLVFFVAVYWLAVQPLYVGEQPKKARTTTSKTARGKKATTASLPNKASTVAKRRSRAAI